MATTFWVAGVGVGVEMVYFKGVYGVFEGIGGNNSSHSVSLVKSDYFLPIRN